MLLLAGREEFTPPTTFAGATCAATHDCLAVGVVAATTSPTTVTLAPSADTAGLSRLGRFVIVSEGLVSLRDIWTREHGAIGVDPGLVQLTVWGDDRDAPGVVVVEVQPAPRA